MKKLKKFFLFTLMPLSMSCFFDASEESTEQQERLLKDKEAESNDAEVEISATQKSCDFHNPCIVVQTGCCSGEKIAAINASAEKSVQAERNKNCNKFFASKSNEGVALDTICAGRENQNRLLTATAQCDKNEKICKLPEAQVATGKNNDAPVAIKDADVACKEDNECTVIDQGCCLGELRIAVRHAAIFELKKTRRANCNKLIAEKAKENAHQNLCHNRKKHGRFMSETAYCKKEVEQPDRKKLAQEIADPTEREKKFQEAFTAWQNASGKCAVK
jgi:hypothetical protein